MNIRTPIQRTLQNCRAQLLLPAVLLLPLFVLVIYLLMEITKVSIVKVRHQLALDSAAYAQVSTVGTFLNATALLNGPFPSRVLKTYDEKLKEVYEDNLYRGKKDWTVFDLFFQAGAIPTIGFDYDKNAIRNPSPKQESTDWGVHYAKYGGIEDIKDEDGNVMYDRSAWEKETPAKITGPVHVMNKEMVDKHYVSYDGVGLSAISAYLSTNAQIADIFNLQKHIYQTLIKGAHIFREGYSVNVKDCKKEACARQSASRLLSFLSIPTKRHETNEIVLYLSNSSGYAGGSGGAIALPWKMDENNLRPLFFFAYVDGAGRSRLRQLKRGILLKQNFPLPRNHFNIDLTAKYKPYVRNTVMLSCPRANNNCVWPNPLPKYSVILRP